MTLRMLLRRRRILLLVVFIFLSTFGSSAQQNGSTDDNSRVSLTVSVWNKDYGYLRNLIAKDFEVYEKKQLYDITSFKQKDEPMSIGILLDLSGSMGHWLIRIPHAVNGLIEFINRTNPENEYFIIGFAQNPTVILAETSDKAKIQDALRTVASIKTKGNTSFYETLSLSLERVSNGKFKKKSLIVISDGTDNSSQKQDFGDLKRLSKNTDTLLYFFNLLTSRNLPSMLRMQGDSFMQVLAENSGGQSFHPQSPQELNQMFALLADELRSQYVLELKAFKKNSWHEIKVRLSRKKATDLGKVVVRTRKGFYF